MKALSTVFFTILLIVVILFINNRLEKTFLGAKGALALLIIAIVAFIVSLVVDIFVIKPHHELENSDLSKKTR